MTSAGGIFTYIGPSLGYISPSALLEPCFKADIGHRRSYDNVNLHAGSHKWQISGPAECCISAFCSQNCHRTLDAAQNRKTPSDLDIKTLALPIFALCAIGIFSPFTTCFRKNYCATKLILASITLVPERGKYDLHGICNRRSRGRQFLCNHFGGFNGSNFSYVHWLRLSPVLRNPKAYLCTVLRELEGWVGIGPMNNFGRTK